MDDQQYLDQAIEDVTAMLAKKKDIWTYNSPVFENFDCVQSFGVTPFQFGLAMCALKLNRLKKCWDKHNGMLDQYIDPDTDDSLLDLACYAILARALFKRGRARILAASEATKADVNQHGCSNAGKAELAKLAAEMLAEDRQCVQNGSSAPMNAATCSLFLAPDAEGDRARRCPLCGGHWTCKYVPEDDAAGKLGDTAEGVRKALRYLEEREAALAS